MLSARISDNHDLPGSAKQPWTKGHVRFGNHLVITRTVLFFARTNFTIQIKINGLTSGSDYWNFFSNNRYFSKQLWGDIVGLRAYVFFKFSGLKVQILCKGVGR